MKYSFLSGQLIINEFNNINIMLMVIIIIIIINTVILIPLFILLLYDID